MKLGSKFKPIGVVFVLIVVVLLICLDTCRAKSSFAVLKIPIGARGIALGGAFCAVAEGKDTLHYNPAGIAYKFKGIDLGLSHTEWLGDVRLEELLAIIAIGPQLSVAFQTLFLNQGKISAYDERAYYTGKYPAANSIISVGVGAKLLPDVLYVGGMLRHIIEKIENYRAYGRSVDLGILLTPRKDLNLGLSLQNFGGKVRFVEQADTIARVIRLGAMKRFKHILTAVDIVHTTHPRSTYPAFGVEYNIRRWGLKVACGVNMNKASDFNRSLSFGFNYAFKNMLLSYSFLSGKRLGGTHRLDFSICLREEPLVKHLPKPTAKRELPKKEKKEAEVFIDSPPQASCEANFESFFPRIESLSFITEASDDIGIAEWKLLIFDEWGELVREFCGSGLPPEKITWDGKDDKGALLPPGKYTYTLSVMDTGQNRVYTPQKTVKLIGF